MESRLARVTAQLQALTRAFFGRFFESDITTGSGDLRGSIFYLLAFLAAPGFAAPFFIGMGASQYTPGTAGWGWNLIGTKLGPQALRLASLNDKTLYLAVSLVASATIGTIVWNSLLPDRRDALVLGTLPVRPGVVVSARLLALFGFTTLVALAMHTLASISFAIFLSPGSGVAFLLGNIGAHFVASCAGSLFVLFTMTALQGVVLVSIGPRRFSRVSPLLQALVAAAIVGGFCAVPPLVAAARETFRPGAAAPSVALLLAPPYWFLGLYETLLGNATPIAHRFATLASSGFAIAVVLTAVTYPLAYRRLMRTAVEGPDSPAWRGLVTSLLTRLLAARAFEAGVVIRFVLTTFARVERHRFALATALGAGIAWATPGWLALARDPHAAPSAVVLAIPFSMLLFGLLGLRMAAGLPADLRASWIFDEEFVPWRTGRLALERILVGLGVLPLTFASTLLYWKLWGGGPALVHLGLLSAIGLLVSESLLWRIQGVPCTRPWTPEAGRIRTRWPFYLGILVAVTSGLPTVERFLFSHLASALLFVCFCSCLAVAIRRAAIKRGPALADTALTIVGSGNHVDRGTSIVAEQPARQPIGEPRFNVGPTLHTRRGRFESWTMAVRGAIRAACSDIVWRDEPQHVRRDVTLAVRAMLRRPAFSIFSAVTSAIGLGAMMAIQAITYAVLLEPVDIPQIDRVVNIYNQEPTRGSLPQITLSKPDLEDLRQQAQSYDAMTAWTPTGASLVGRGFATALNPIEAVDGAYFDFMGAAIQAGRPITANDNRPGAPLTVVLSDSVWRRWFGAEPTILGRSISLDDHLATVVGVAAPSVRGVFMPNIRPTAAWIPLTAVRQDAFGGYANEDDRRNRFLFVKGRLKSGVSPDEAATELSSLANRLDKAFPLDPDPRFHRRWTLLSASEMHVLEPVTRYAMPLATVLMVGVGLVLFVTCTNLSNLTLARGATVRGAVAVRLALGASRRRLVQQQIIEVALLAIAGGAGAAILAQTLLDVVARGSLRLAPGLTAHVTPTLTSGSWMVLTGGIALAVIVCGVWPALQLTAVSITAHLSAASNRVAGHWRGRRWMVATQVAASVVLLSTAAVFLGELTARARPFARFGLDRVAVVTLQMSKDQRTSGSLRTSLQTIVARLERQPGVAAAAFTSALPIGAGPSGTIADPGGEPRPVSIALGSATTIDALGIRLIAGRAFRDSDDSHEVVISDAVARQIFGRSDVIGRAVVLRQNLRDEGMSLTITGIAEDTPAVTPARGAVGWVYRPPTTDVSRITLLARGAPGIAAPVGLLQAVVRETDPNLPIVDSTTAALAAGVDTPLSRVAGTVAGILGAAALAMSMVGLFGVLSQRVTDRRRELGIRGALGAARGDILRLVIADGLRPVSTGFAIGVIAALVVQLSLEPYVGPIMPTTDRTVLLPVPALLLCAALAACYLPARKALAVDPAAAIRDL